VELPSAAAYALNKEGRQAYRERRWEDARRRYRAAHAADPAFVAPLLNVACSFVQEGRFGEGAAAAAELVGTRFVPWARHVRTSADLAPLHPRREMAVLEAALSRAAVAWGESVLPGLFFIARTQPPVRIGERGTFVLSPHQEIFAWAPDTGRYRQVSAEDGRVLAFVRSRSGRRLVYVLGGKVIRGDGPPRLRDLALRAIELPTMALGPPVPLGGDAEEIALAFEDEAAASLRVRRGGRSEAFRFDGRALLEAATGAPAGRSGIVLGAAGVAAQGPSRRAGGDCGFDAADVRTAEGAEAVQVRPLRGRAFLLRQRYGAGLHGLPFPSASVRRP
jgi:hypothetical protein